MVVRIRFGQGPVVSRHRGRNGRLATLSASLLTMLSICFASLGAWCLGQDLGWAGNFVIVSGLLSHWLVWFALAVAAQYGSWRCVRVAAAARVADADPGAPAGRETESDVRAAANF